MLTAKQRKKKYLDTAKRIDKMTGFAFLCYQLDIGNKSDEDIKEMWPEFYLFSPTEKFYKESWWYGQIDTITFKDINNDFQKFRDIRVVALCLMAAMCE